MIERIKSEPALVSAFVNTVLLCVLAFGVDLSVQQIAAVMAVVNAGLALVVRRQVTPTRDL